MIQAHTAEQLNILDGHEFELEAIQFLFQKTSIVVDIIQAS